MPPWVFREFGGRKPPRHRRNSVSPCSKISPFGGSRIWREEVSLTSTKLYFSKFRDKPPCMPLYFGTVDYTARGGRAFFFFFSLYSSSSFLGLCNSGFFLSFFFLLFFSSCSRSLCLCFSFSSRPLSLTQFSTWIGYVIVLGSVFGPDGLGNCLKLHLVQLMKY